MAALTFGAFIGTEASGLNPETGRPERVSRASGRGRESLYWWDVGPARKSIHWEAVGTGLPNVPVNDLRYIPKNHTLYAGTFDHGVWSLALGS